MAVRLLSIIDASKIDEVKDMIIRDDMDSFYKVLYDIGFDTSKDIVFEVCWHRPMNSTQTVQAGRWRGTERVDKDWLLSEHCTMENRLERCGTKDVYLLKDLLDMSRLPHYTSMIISHMEGDDYSPTVKYVKEEGGEEIEGN